MTQINPSPDLNWHECTPTSQVFSDRSVIVLDLRRTGFTLFWYESEQETDTYPSERAHKWILPKAMHPWTDPDLFFPDDSWTGASTFHSDMTALLLSNPRLPDLWFRISQTWSLLQDQSNLVLVQDQSDVVLVQVKIRCFYKYINTYMLFWSYFAP